MNAIDKLKFLASLKLEFQASFDNLVKPGFLKKSERKHKGRDITVWTLCSRPTPAPNHVNGAAS